MMKTITKDQAKAKMRSGKIFSATFVKKDGSLRKMHARMGVKQGVKGVGKAYNPEDFGYLTVFDLRAHNFRTLNTNTLQELTLGDKFVVV